MTSCCINFAIISNGFTSPFGKKEKKNCHLYNTILSLYISYQVSTYHIKTLQEESAKKSNIPWIWRIIYGHKLPYMKKTKITLYEEDKKEEASMRCSLLNGSWDQILRRRPSVCRRHGFRSISQVCFGISISNFMHVDGGHRQKPIDFQLRHFQNGRLVAILDFLVSRL